MKNELKNGQRFLGIDNEKTTNHKQQTLKHKHPPTLNPAYRQAGSEAN